VSQTIALIATAGANFASVRFALERMAVAVTATTDPVVVARADKVILPGVGAAAHAMQTLQQYGLDQCLKSYRKPLLGICLGMQLLFEYSDEGDVAGLGLLPGTVSKFPPTAGRVPHVGWNNLRIIQQNSGLLRDIADGGYAYFVHSYYAPLVAATAASCDYGGSFTAAVQQDHLFGCQFHPERSGALGQKLLENFVSL
jgi:imidazole glycerol-phosphate synthase subunit HisH